MKKRIAFAQIIQEQNFFSPLKTTIDDFEQNGIYYREKVLENISQNSGLNGFIEAAKTEKNIELVPIMKVASLPKGPIIEKDYNNIKNKLISILKESMPLDGILLSLHGAMSSEKTFDIEGDILESIHKEVSKYIPISVSIDLHANLTDKMIANACFTEGFKTSPHIDMFETGYRVAKALFNILENKLILKSYFVKIPMITGARLHNTNKGAFKKLFDLVRSIENKPDVFGASLFAVQPWLDVPELGWSALVYSDKQDSKSGEYANKIARMAWEIKDKLVPEELSVKEALDKIKKYKKGLVVFSDNDSTTSGASGDNTCVLEEVLRQEVDYPVLLTVVDQEVVQKAVDIGVGNKITALLGGKVDKYCNPVKISALVKSVMDKDFFSKSKSNINHYGYTIDPGRIVILKVKEINIVASEKTCMVFEPSFYENLGFNLKDFKIVLVKSPMGFRYFYEKIAKSIVLLNCPGLASSNFNLYEYKNITRPLYPLDKDIEINFG